MFRRKVEPLRAALASLSVPHAEVYVVPDTNVLLFKPDIGDYGTALGATAYAVWLVPPVLEELDSHKVNHRNEAVREKARKFTNRPKGWRAQGSLLHGVRVVGEVFVRVEGKEPDKLQTGGLLDGGSSAAGCGKL